MHRRFFIILGVVFAAAAFMVVQATRDTAALVLLPSDLLRESSNKVLSRIRVGARVADLPISYIVQPNIELRFSVHDPGRTEETVPVVYNNLKPDMFAPGRDVIIDGEFRNGTLYAIDLLTQCPSKYEPPDSPREQ